MANSYSWCRFYSEMPNDPKWGIIARVSKQRLGDVIAVYCHLLASATSNEPTTAVERSETERGLARSARSEDIAFAIQVDTDQVDAILAAMQGRVLDGMFLIGWEKRQPLGGTEGAERSREWREKKKKEKAEAASRDRDLANETEHTRTYANVREHTQADASVRERSRTTDKNREEKNREEKDQSQNQNLKPGSDEAGAGLNGHIAGAGSAPKPKLKPELQAAFADSRFVPFKAAIAAYWKFANPADPEVIWDGTDGTQLNRLLQASPALEVSKLQSWLQNRWRSEETVHSERVFRWITSVSKYAEGPLDRFGKPLERPVRHDAEVGMYRATPSQMPTQPPVPPPPPQPPGGGRSPVRFADNAELDLADEIARIAKEPMPDFAAMPKETRQEAEQATAAALRYRRDHAYTLRAEQTRWLAEYERPPVEVEEAVAPNAETNAPNAAERKQPHAERRRTPREGAAVGREQSQPRSTAAITASPPALSGIGVA